MSSTTASNITSGFIDLATFDELEKYMYGGPDATAYFVRETRKATWFTQVPVVLSKASGQPGFGSDWAVSISRAGDYLLQTWLRVEVPAVQAAASTGGTGYVNGVRWTNNLGHNLIKECSITFNDLVAARFDSYHLDFWAGFTTPAGKIDGYNNMVGGGDINALSNTTMQGVAKAASVVNVPLPFFFSRDSGVALPTAALPYNDMRIQMTFRDWSELLIVDTWNGSNVYLGSTPATASLLTQTPVLGTTNVWANYAIVSNDERKRMACAPRDILIEQVQTAPRQNFNPAQNPNPSYDIRFSHAIKVLFFAARNKSLSSSWSIYQTVLPTPINTVSIPYGGALDWADDAVDPVKSTSLVYENTQRLSNMSSDYYSLVCPWYNAPTIPVSNVTTGFHMYSYSLDFICLDPMGSTNYGKLTNVSIQPNASDAAITAANATAQDGPILPARKQTYEFVVTAVNNNIIRVSGGALGFPVL